MKDNVIVQMIMDILSFALHRVSQIKAEGREKEADTLIDSNRTLILVMFVVIIVGSFIPVIDANQIGQQRAEINPKGDPGPGLYYAIFQTSSDLNAEWVVRVVGPFGEYGPYTEYTHFHGRIHVSESVADLWHKNFEDCDSVGFDPNLPAQNPTDILFHCFDPADAPASTDATGIFEEEQVQKEPANNLQIKDYSIMGDTTLTECIVESKDIIFFRSYGTLSTVTFDLYIDGMQADPLQVRIGENEINPVEVPFTLIGYGNGESAS